MHFKRISFTLLLIISCNNIYSQYNTMREWYIGISGGKTGSTINMVPKLVDKLFSFNNNIGLSARFISEEHFGIQTELSYYQNGWKEDLSGTGLTYSYERQLELIEIPFLMHAYTGNDRMHYFLNLGPKVGYIFSDKENIIDNSTVFAQHGKAIEKPFQYGLLAGAGFEAHFGRSVIGLEGRYCYNFSNIFKDDIGEYFNTSSIQTASVNIFYYLKF